jgi:hypothetical protein
MISSQERRERWAAWLDASDALVERRERQQRETAAEEAAEAKRVRARQAYFDGLAESPDGRELGDVLAQIRDSPPPRDPSRERLLLLGLAERSQPVDVVERVRVRRALRLARLDDARKLRAVEQRRGAWLATAGDLGVRTSGAYDASKAELLRRAAQGC